MLRFNTDPYSRRLLSLHGYHTVTKFVDNTNDPWGPIRWKNRLKKYRPSKEIKINLAAARRTKWVRLDHDKDYYERVRWNKHVR